MKHAILLSILFLLFLLAGSALAMSSPNYRLDWFTPLTGAGGGESSSAQYAANFTVGQTVIGTSASEHYGVGLGYWVDFLSNFLRNVLPLVTKN